MKSASRLVRIPALLALAVIAAGAATFWSETRESNVAVPVASVEAASADDVAFLGEMTVSANRLDD